MKAATATHATVTNSYTLTVTAAPVLTPSTIVFADATVSKLTTDANFTNTVTGDGTGAITYTSGTPATATVNETTGEVTIVGVGTTVITAVKAATATHATVTNSYTLTVTEGLTVEEIAATTAVEKAESSKTMVDIVAAKDLVIALSNGAKKTELQGRLNDIDNIIVMDEHQLDLALNTSATTIVLGDNFSTTAQYYAISKAGVTIDGGNKTITGSLRVVADNVKLKNLIVDLAMTTPGDWVSGSFAVQVYGVTGVTIDNVTLKNANVGLYVNSASVTVNNIHTKDNGFGGIGVAQSTTNVTTAPVLQVTGVNTHSDAINMPHIYTDQANSNWVTANNYTAIQAGEVWETGIDVKVGQTWFKMN